MRSQASSTTASFVRSELFEARNLIDRVLADDSLLATIQLAAEALTKTLERGSKILTCGNGGSLCDAMHFAAELSGKYRNPRRPLCAVALNDPALLSSVGNDFSFSEVFSRTIRAIGAPGDTLVALSTSGLSPNVVRAAIAARDQGLQVLALTGRGGGVLGPMATLEIRVPPTHHADRTQELHIKILHILVALIEQHLHVAD